ncbi:LCP family protein [Ammoniphilus sp. CFH 90114]|uniref:LCP family protein n=1 Tax=Ammoniphilus sp. CFH 90114 TaxID=2493665 RepID=UPI0013E98306|nr:LCP family protein [Ammoniphilus sp. CFH 90114]
MKRVILLAILFFFVGTIGVAGYGYLKYKDMTEQWYVPLENEQPEEAVKEKGEEKPERKEQKKEPEKVELSPFNVMLLGVDTRGEKKSRSDTIMLAAVNPMLQKVSLLSIPRDTVARIPGYGKDKFNHAMFYGGPSLVKKTMEEFFDIEVEHYITLDFEGFTKLVDELGGIEVDVKRRMKYYDPTDGTNIDIRAGLQELNGKEALDYARFRKSDIGSDASDFDRMDRQQEVVRKLVDKATSFSSVLRIFHIMEIIGDNVKMDFREEEVRKLAMLFRNFSSSSIATIELQGTNERMPMHGYNMWVYTVNNEEKKRIQGIIQDTLEVNSPIENAAP